MNKKEKIIETALLFFASKGFDGTSTSSIAKQAGVSEGLIFKHFKNKQGLLDAILEFGLGKARDYFLPIYEATDPKEKIERFICLPITIPPSDYDFWRLLYALKWRRGEYDSTVFDEVIKSLTDAFKQLGYPDPETEAKFLEIYMDGTATVMLLKGNEGIEKIVNNIKHKYHLQSKNNENN